MEYAPNALDVIIKECPDFWEALDSMVQDAQKMGANAVVRLSFSTSMIMGGASEILAYGTAVVVE